MFSRNICIRRDEDAAESENKRAKTATTTIHWGGDREKVSCTLPPVDIFTQTKSLAYKPPSHDGKLWDAYLFRLFCLCDLFQSLREVIPHVANKARRLSKLETLTLAKNYIVALTGMMVGQDDDKDLLAGFSTTPGNGQSSILDGPLSKDCLLQAAAEAAADEFEFDLDLNIGTEPGDTLDFYDT